MIMDEIKRMREQDLIEYKKADSAGFCFGVNRAINIVNELLKKE